MADRLDKYTEQIEDLINEFPDDLFIELLDEMIDRARTAREARLEETALELDPEDDD